MGKRPKLNARRLTRKEVEEIVNTEGTVLNEGWTKAREETYASGHVDRPRVYELPGDRVLFVFPDGATGSGGKGDIYTQEYWLRSMAWRKRVQQDHRNHAAWSFANWKFYSQHGGGLIQQIDALINDLAQVLAIERRLLDLSYASLDAVSEAVERMGVDRARETIYDNLVAYIGEVLRKRTKGVWTADTRFQDDRQQWFTIPAISSATKGSLSPVNIVWEELLGPDLVDLRRATTNAVRRAG